MPYNKLLNNIVADSNLKYKTIAQKCTELGTPIDASYISKLLAGKYMVPSEKVSRAIAKVCNYDESLLVLEGYLDNAPKEILDALNIVRFYSCIFSTKIYENILDSNNLEILKNLISNEPLSSFVVDMAKLDTTSVTSLKNSLKIEDMENMLSLIINKAPTLTVTDNSMYPIIPKKSEITLEFKKKYNNGDIIAFKLKSTKNFMIRYFFNNNNQIMLTALNTTIAPIIVNENEISILGKVSTVTKKL